MKITVITIFPEFFASFTSTSIIKRAIESGRVEFETVDFRTFTLDRHRHVDDTPYGGGQGMVLSPQPIADALRAIRQPNSHVVMMTPQGRTFDQQQARRLSAKEHLIFLCGHYEGFDERIRSFADEEISIGDYVLTGGEPAAMVVCDAVIRLQDGVILEQSRADDSFSDGLLEHPQYTKPAQFEGMGVPDVLLSGHHANIRRWRLKQSLERTLQRRPDLLEERAFSEEELSLIDELCLERSKNICGE